MGTSLGNSRASIFSSGQSSLILDLIDAHYDNVSHLDVAIVATSSTGDNRQFNWG
jgi:hypothetical protein